MGCLASVALVRFTISSLCALQVTGCLYNGICVRNAASGTQSQIGKARQSVGNAERTFAPMTPLESRRWSEGHKAAEIAVTNKRGNKIDLQKTNS